ncbi:MAG TPA: acyl-CoA dehydrogenase family protein [Steroidobacteraceae bacterium]|nr:acyl-CoA dehydrogenase family protein [Steroidobacteraceae bacterium]
MDNKAKDDAMQLAEDARQAEWESVSFTAELFKGSFRWDLVHPFPAQPPEDKRIGDEYLEKVRAVLEKHVDPYRIDEEGEYPREALDAMAAIGLFGMKIPQEYGGLGLSVTNYARVLGLVGSYCSNTVTYLSAHQSIGVPQPLREFGTEDQKRKYLPRLASGELSAFALTEPDVGSDPARMTTVATPSDDGESYLLNGDKLWCTNVTDPKTTLIAVLARTPDKVLPNGKSVPQISCFVVETAWPGVERVRRSRFMGLHGIANGAVTFKDVKVPAENMIGRPGEGLKIALATLNVGRLGLPAAGIGAGMAYVDDAKWWITHRQQWGVPVGKHQAIAKMVANYAAHLFGMKSMVYLACAFADRKHADIRLEAAAAKYFCSETLSRILDDYMQVRGGRGYERATSLYERGERPTGLEMTLRDMRVGRIFEGSSQVMHLIMAREALDTHFKLVMPILQPKPGQKIGKGEAMSKAAAFYATWLPKLFVPDTGHSFEAKHLNEANGKHLAYAAKTSRLLARRLFATMAKYGPKLEREQLILGNFVDIGVDLFVMASSLSYADHLLGENPADTTPQELADLFCREARRRIEANFRAVKSNHNRSYRKVTDLLMDGKLGWLADGSTNPIPPQYRDWQKNDYEHPARTAGERRAAEAEAKAAKDDSAAA